MMNAIAELGKYELTKNKNTSRLDIWLENSYHEKNYPHLLLIVFQKDSKGSWDFLEVSYREHSNNFMGKLLYKTGSSRGTDKTPTCKVAKSLEGSYQQKIVKWFTNNHNSELLTKEQTTFLTAIHNIFTEKSTEINNALIEQSELLDKKGIVISCCFIESNQTQFIGDIDFFKLFITEECKTGYMFSKTFGESSFAKNELCSICRNKQPEVYGYFTSLKFYTVDKRSMVTGGFEQKDSWKNYPVCFLCALDIEMGIKTMEMGLNFNFYGLKYYMLPNAIHKNGYEDIMDNVFNFSKSPKIRDKERLRITNDEQELFEMLKEQQDIASLNLLFYQKKNAAFIIKASITQVLPSRLKTLFLAKDFVDNFFPHELSKEEKHLFRFHFGFLRTFFPAGSKKKKSNYDKAFLEIIQKIFADRRIDYNFIVMHFMLHLRKAFIKDEYLWIETLKSFAAIYFLFYLNLFRTQKGIQCMDNSFFNSFTIESAEELEQKVMEFFENFKDFFCSDQHCAIFLTGVLAQFLLNIQKQERNAEPFRSRLKGLKMNARDITSLLPEIVDKLEQYKQNYYKALENIISKYFLASGNYNNWKMSVDEMNYTFILGMNLSKYFKVKTEKKGENNE